MSQEVPSTNSHHHHHRHWTRTPTVNSFCPVRSPLLATRRLQQLPRSHVLCFTQAVCAFSNPLSPVVPLSTRASLLPPHPRRLSFRHSLTTLLYSPDHPACTTARSWPVRRNTPSRATQSLKQWAADNLRLESSQSSRQSTLGAARCSSPRFTLNLALAANLARGSVASKLDRQ